ncbi:histidine kinase [Knoellia sinensis KCTC 19936]|uniref:Histidine kinase n=1 Tax=Knoellia sinensis KCTC 19936 TaxID=1385520 RepID=A0A0A0J3C9_9MICO|nr:ATP-binding protein [Knoellia sinensis]KGN31673.1 histidine kinase [Knoellia sinensis KCTC 19936]
MTETSRGVTAAAWWPWLLLPAIASALVASGLVLGAATDLRFGEDVESFVNVPLALGFSTVAAGIWATRPDTRGLKRLGLLYTVVGLASAVVFPAHAWANAGRDLLGADFAGWLGEWVWALGAAPLMGIGLVLYPDGEVPGRRWWPVPVGGVLAVVLLAGTNALMAFEPTRAPAWEPIAFAAFVLLLACAGAGLVALCLRFVRAAPGSDLRGQVGAFLIAGFLVVGFAALPDGNTPAHLVIALMMGAALPATVASAVVRHRLLDQQALAARLETVSASRQALVTEREDERLRLRRDLHDGLGPSLAAIGLGLRQLQRDVPDTQHVVVTALADEVQRAVVEVRRLCDGLSPDALQDLGLSTALAEVADRLGALGGPEVVVTAGPLPPLPAAHEVVAYRVLMEATTNAVRHSGASRVTVGLHWADGLHGCVEDDGAGIPAGARAGVGLRAMTERADELGGRTTVGPSDTGGTRVSLWLPGVHP